MANEAKNVIRVGSRKSELALIQTNFVIDSLKKIYPDKNFTIVSMTLPKIWEESLFTNDLEDALRSDKVDFVVHSLEDLPTTLPAGLAVGAVFEREDPRDALVLREDMRGHTLSSLPAGSVIGTSSLRRTAQLKASHPHLSVADIHGNLNTRLQKLDAEPPQFAALLLASAELQRLGRQDRISQVLPCDEILYAVGQGALAVECRAADAPLLEMLAPFNHAETYCRVLVERCFLGTLGGDCSAPVGVSTTLEPFESGFKLSICGAVWSSDGSTKIDHSLYAVFSFISLHKSEDTRTMDESLSLKKKSIFYGLAPNDNVPIDVIVRCEILGKYLAKHFISKGAVDLIKIDNLIKIVRQLNNHDFF